VLNHGKIPRLAALVLRVAIAGQCVALGWKHLFGATPFNSLLVVAGFGAGPTQVVDYVAGFVLVLLAGMVLARPLRWVLALVALWFALHALAGWWNHATDADALFYQLGPAAQAVRWLAPVGLILLVSGYVRSAMWVLLVASCATFIGHGIKDVLHYNPYVDLINNTLTNHTDIKWPLEKTKMVLRAIGFIDIAAAGLLLLSRWRWLALPMAIWGGIAAFSRVTANGAEAWPEVLLRVCNAAVPFVVFLLLCTLVRKTRHASEPDVHWDFTPADSERRGTIPVGSDEAARAAAEGPRSSSRSSHSRSSSKSAPAPRDIYE